MSEFDYEKILRAYIWHVGNMEGVSFLEDDLEYTMLLKVGLDDDEAGRLFQLAKEGQGKPYINRYTLDEGDSEWTL